MQPSHTQRESKKETPNLFFHRPTSRCTRMISVYHLFIALSACPFTHLPVAFFASNSNRGEIYFQPKNTALFLTTIGSSASEKPAAALCFFYLLFFFDSVAELVECLLLFSMHASTSVSLSFTLPHSLCSVAQTRCLLCEIQPGGKWKSPYSLPDTIIFTFKKDTKRTRLPTTNLITTSELTSSNVFRTRRHQSGRMISRKLTQKLLHHTIVGFIV